MNRDDAIVYFESLLKRFEEMRETETSYWGKVHTETTIEATRVALSALRPVSRERIENVWRGEWVHKRSPYDYKIFVCKKCGKQISIQGENMDFCPACGSAQTDEAVQMVMERMEALYEKT